MHIVEKKLSAFSKSVINQGKTKHCFYDKGMCLLVYVKLLIIKLHIYDSYVKQIIFRTRRYQMKARKHLVVRVCEWIQMANVVSYASIMMNCFRKHFSPQISAWEMHYSNTGNRKMAWFERWIIDIFRALIKICNS